MSDRIRAVTFISRTFLLSSLRLLSLIGLPLTELDGKDDKLPCLLLAFLKWPSIRPGRAPSIFKTSPYIVSSPSSCDFMCRKPWVSVSESLTDWPAPHAPPSSESKSKDLVVVDVRSSSPNTKINWVYTFFLCNKSLLSYSVASSKTVLVSSWSKISSVLRVSVELNLAIPSTVQCIYFFLVDCSCQFHTLVSSTSKEINIRD